MHSLRNPVTQWTLMPQMVLTDLENELLYLTDKIKTLMSTNLDLSQMEEILLQTDEYLNIVSIEKIS